jgi:hypothetical protein
LVDAVYKVLSNTLLHIMDCAKSRRVAACSCAAHI